MWPVVIVGLGNPGKKYAKTRHNIGFMAVKCLAEKLGWPFKNDERFLGQVAKGTIKTEASERTVYLLLPETYMNESGRAVQALSHYYKVLAPEILIVQDDIAIPFNTLRVRLKGSSGGHNGLKSIESALGTPNTPRLKLGIGDERTGELSDHVLAPFTESEQEVLPEFIERAAAVLAELLTQDIHRVMTAVNVKKGKIENETKDQPV